MFLVIGILVKKLQLPANGQLLKLNYRFEDWILEYLSIAQLMYELVRIKTGNASESNLYMWM